MNPAEVVLTWPQIISAAQIGVMRQAKAVLKNYEFGENGRPTDPWGAHIEGAAGEVAAARVINKFWDMGVDTFKTGGDVGRMVEVRTRLSHDKDLCVLPSDRPEAIYIAVTGTIPAFKVWGWVYGHEAQVKEFERHTADRGLVYFVPKDRLRELSELPW